jgi:hypothetical protein
LPPSAATVIWSPVFDQFQCKVVHRIDVVPGFVGRRPVVEARRLDHVEVDAIGPEVRPPEQDQYLDRSLLRPGQRSAQAPALRGRHGAVVELEVEESDAGGFLIGDILPGRVVDAPPGIELRLRQRHRLRGKCQRSGQLDAVRTLDVANPDRTIDGAPQQRSLAPGDDLARRAAGADFFGPGVENVAGLAEQGIGDAGKAIGGIDLA